MTPLPLRSVVHDPREPVVHEIAPLRFAGLTITVRVRIHRSDEGGWRGRLQFADETGAERETAEILCGATEEELWQSVLSLRPYHLHDLYRSLA